jgi:hypothetical protein
MASALLSSHGRRNSTVISAAMSLASPRRAEGSNGIWAETWAGDLNKCGNHMGDEVRTGIPADSDEVAQAFRNDVARRYEMMPPSVPT